MDPFKSVAESMKITAEGVATTHRGIVQASEGLQQTTEGLRALAEAVVNARDEYSDLREPVARLEALAIEQGQELRAVREQLRELRERRNGGS